jgi:hypothetical protein
MLIGQFITTFIGQFTPWSSPQQLVAVVRRMAAQVAVPKDSPHRRIAGDDVWEPQRVDPNFD